MVALLQLIVAVGADRERMDGSWLSACIQSTAESVCVYR